VSTPTLYKPDEVAAIIRRNKQTVLRYRREGKLRGTLVGGGYLFSQDQIDEFLAGGATTATEAKPSKPSRHPRYSK
jgi:excisionase family DNA binding protein